MNIGRLGGLYLLQSAELYRLEDISGKLREGKTQVEIDLYKRLRGASLQRVNFLERQINEEVERLARNLPIPGEE